MDKQQAAADIIAEALPLIPFEGWTLVALEQAAVKAGYKKSDIVRVFPGGAIEAVDAFSALGDEALRQALKNQPFSHMKFRERIAHAVRLRIELNTPYREAVRRAVAMHTLPFYAWRGLRALYDTVDTIWRESGDTSTDTSFYTKRLTLAGVYSSTSLYWLDDRSAGSQDSWAFLDRRIDDVMTLGKLKKKIIR